MENRLKSDKLRFRYINRFIKGEEILDLGASEGNVHKLIVERNSERKIYSCDMKNADFNRDLNRPFKIKKRFDTIIAGEIIEHIENPSLFLKECRKILKDKGRLILTTPNAIGLQYIKNPSWCVNYKKPVHINCFTMPMLKSIFIKEKLKIIHTDFINAFWINNPLQIIPMFLKRFRTDLMIVAEK